MLEVEPKRSVCIVQQIYKYITKLYAQWLEPEPKRKITSSNFRLCLFLFSKHD